MKIERVTYRELVSGPGYNHKAIEGTALVEPGESPEQALDALRVWVRTRHTIYGNGDKRLEALLDDEMTVASRVRLLEAKSARLDRELAQSGWWGLTWRLWRRRWGAWRSRWQAWRDGGDDVPF